MKPPLTVGLDAVAAALRQARRVAIVMHQMPDGDTTGSALGLALALRASGTDVLVTSPDPVLPAYRFLPASAEVLSFGDAVERGPRDLVVAVDCGSPGRSFGMTNLRKLAPLLLNIDHHRSNSAYGDLNWIEPAAPSVGEMVLRLLDKIGIPLTRDIALCLYVSLAADTEGLQFGFHDSYVLETAARLVRAGVDPALVSRELWEERSLSQLKLTGWVLSHVEVSRSGQVAWVAVPRAVFDSTGSEPYQSEGLVNHLRALAGVKLAVLLREEHPNVWKLSVRSRLPWEASAVAAALGGGGHTTSAGAQWSGSLEEAMAALMQAVHALYGEAKPWTASLTC